MPKMLFDIASISAIDEIFEDACIVKSQVQPNRKYKRKRVENAELISEIENLHSDLYKLDRY